MAKRKTYPVADIVNCVNRHLASDMSTADGRRALIGLVETILHNTGNDNVFRYLDSELWYSDREYERDEYSPLLRKGYDHTRRRYNMP